MTEKRKPNSAGKKKSVPRRKRAPSPTTLQRRHLDLRLAALHRRAAILEKQLQALDDPRFYRTCIFGSARIKPETKVYADVVALARLLAEAGIDVLTGGGPGLMEAANKGAMFGREEKSSRSMSYGMTIQLEHEPVPNTHLDIKRHHLRFSSRLDDFMRLSHSIVVTQGGIGTLLELYFAWQLIQVKHIPPRPIVLLDSAFWSGLTSWMKDEVLLRNLISAPDIDLVKIVDTPEEAAALIIEDRLRRGNSVKTT